MQNLNPMSISVARVMKTSGNLRKYYIYIYIGLSRAYGAGRWKWIPNLDSTGQKTD